MRKSRETIEHEARLHERAKAQPMTASCALCPWSFSGTTGAALEAAREHRKNHPPARARRTTHRRTAQSPTVFNSKHLEENVAATRAAGGAAWIPPVTVAEAEAEPRFRRGGIRLCSTPDCDMDAVVGVRCYECHLATSNAKAKA